MLEVISPGALATVQDTGRFGAQALGIGSAGAMDVFAARVANALLGNAERAPVIEVTAGSAQFGFGCAGVFAVCGADLDATLDGLPVALCAPMSVAPGQILRFGRARRGWRACLAVAGGFAADEVLGSASTDLRGGFGGHQGRALRRGDRIDFGAACQPARASRRMSTTLANPPHMPDAPLGLIAGPAFAQLDAADRRALREARFTVSRDADRMGLRLEPALASAAALPQQLSAAVVSGAVQLPPDGKAIILGADRQTTGGYPLAGVVAGVDHWRIAQARPGESLAFRLIEPEAARQAWRVREQALARLAIVAAAAWQGA